MVVLMQVLLACLITSTTVNLAAALAPPPDLMVARHRGGYSQASTNGLSRLLTQRAVQQTIFYQGVQNDEVMARWLGEFMQTDEGCCLSPDFHGVDALPSSSSASYICGLLCLPPTLISVRRPSRRPPGGSRNNPYVTNAFDDIAVKVPASFLAESIMNMRSTVANEWLQDLELFPVEDHALRTQHAAAIKAGVVGSDANADAVKRNTATSMPSFDVGRLGSEGGRRSSPFRLASYDLLKLLATRAAMDRVLAEEHSQLLPDESSLQWLLRFWESRRSDFCGHSTWTQGDGSAGASDSLLVALFNAAPSLVTTESGTVVLVDPGGLAETILTIRGGIAKEWAEALELVKDEHECWQRYGGAK